MRTVTVDRTIDAPPSSVWAVLADYPNIDRWNEGVLTSESLGEATEGVGAQRRCDLAPKGAMRMRETVAEWTPEERMVIDIDQFEKMPVASARMTFTLADSTDGTRFTMRYDYEPKGFLFRLMGPMMDKQMHKGFNGFVDDLEPTAQAVV